MFLSKRTSAAFDELVGAFFDLNRTVDAMCSVLLNKWCMPQAENILHHKHAHLYPLLADEFSEFKADCNMKTAYPQTHQDSRDYSNLLDMMDTYLKEVLEVYEMLKMVYKLAKEEGDLNACAMIINFMPKMTKVIGQVYTLRDKAEQMPTDYDKYDYHIATWGIVGLELG